MEPHPEQPLAVPAQHTPPAAVEPAAEAQLPAEPNKLRRYLQECLRVLKVTKKPTMQEFKTIVKVSGLGMLLIGLIGFAINLIKELFLN